MFPRAQRFRSPPPESIPPPGAYDVPVTSPEAAYKKGAMLETAKRFHPTAEALKPDTFGLYNVDGGDKENQQPRKRVASAVSGGASLQAERERHKQQLEDLRHRLSASNEKEVAKLNTKIGRIEAARDETAKEKGDLAKEASGLKSEIRHLTSKLTKTEALLTKHQSTLPLLQAKLTSLQTSNDASRARKDSELSALAAKLASVEGVLTTRSGELARARKELSWERAAREQQAEAAGKAIAAERAETRNARVVELHMSRLREVKLQRQLEDRTAQVETLAAYAAGLEEKADELVSQAKMHEEDSEKLRASWRGDRMLLVEERNEKEWRQRARADEREADGLRKEVEGMREMEVVDRESRKMGEWVEKERRSRWRAEKKEMQRDYEVVEGELDLAVNTEIPRLESLLSEATSSFEVTSDDLLIAQSDIADLQQRLVDETERLEGELEEQKRIASEKTKEADKERTEKKRVVGLLAQTRASEGALSGEVEVLSAELSRLSPLVSTTSQQQQQIDHLARLSSAAEAESRQLMAENAELVGHGNGQQRIKHVAQLREELAESRRKHLATTSTLSFAEQRIAALETELSSYRAVPATSSSSLPQFTFSSSLHPPSSVRSRVTRPQMSDAMSSSSAPFSAFATTSAPKLTQPRCLLPSLPPPTIVTHEPSPSPSFPPTHAYLSSSALPPARPPLSTLLSDAPLLSPSLAKSQPTLPSAAVVANKAKRPVNKLPPPSKSQYAKKGRFLGDEEGSTSVRMEGRMSVSELFN